MWVCVALVCWKCGDRVGKVVWSLMTYAGSFSGDTHCPMCNGHIQPDRPPPFSSCFLEQPVSAEAFGSLHRCFKSSSTLRFPHLIQESNLSTLLLWVPTLLLSSSQCWRTVSLISWPTSSLSEALHVLFLKIWTVNVHGLLNLESAYAENVVRSRMVNRTASSPFLRGIWSLNLSNMEGK